MSSINVLILEDDLHTLSVIMHELSLLEEDMMQGEPYADFGVTVISNYKDVEDLINKRDADDYDLILLDRDCRLGGSFHVLNMEKFGLDKIISISSIPEYNQQAHERGVGHVIHKDVPGLQHFTPRLRPAIKDVLGEFDIEEYFYKAARLGLDAGLISAGLVQRRLQVSDELAIRIMDELTKRGFVSNNAPSPRTLSYSSMKEIRW